MQTLYQLFTLSFNIDCKNQHNLYLSTYPLNYKRISKLLFYFKPLENVIYWQPQYQYIQSIPICNSLFFCFQQSEFKTETDYFSSKETRIDFKMFLSFADDLIYRRSVIRNLFVFRTLNCLEVKA